MSKPLFTVVEFLWKTCHWISWQFKRENVKRGHAWHHAASAWMITVFDKISLGGYYIEKFKSFTVILLFVRCTSEYVWYGMVPVLVPAIIIQYHYLIYNHKYNCKRIIDLSY